MNWSIHIPINGMILIMSDLILGFFVIGLSFAGLAIGLILKNEPIKGSCGGMANLDDGSPCQICGRSDTEACSD
jgi:hypothetical protein